MSLNRQAIANHLKGFIMLNCYFVQFGGMFAGQPVVAGYFDATSSDNAVSVAIDYFTMRDSALLVRELLSIGAVESFIYLVSI